jgi:PKD repeat protein
LLPAPVKQVFDSFELIAERTDPLTVEITSEDMEGIAPATFEFEADVAGGMEPYTISWDYGNGSSGEEEEENDEDIEHTFDNAGMYNVRVSVTDSTGRAASDSMLIIVDEPPPLTAVNIISNSTGGIAPATFEFEADVTGGTGPYTYRWDFGDGSSSSSRESNTQTILHTFEEAGRYNVGVTVIDSRNQIAFDSIVITVEGEEEEEQPILGDIDDNSRSDAFFDLDDSQNNGITVGGTSAADDYDATAED